MEIYAQGSSSISIAVWHLRRWSKFYGEKKSLLHEMFDIMLQGSAIHLNKVDKSVHQP